MKHNLSEICHVLYELLLKHSFVDQCVVSTFMPLVAEEMLSSGLHEKLTFGKIYGGFSKTGEPEGEVPPHENLLEQGFKFITVRCDLVTRELGSFLKENGMKLFAYYPGIWEESE